MALTQQVFLVNNLVKTATITASSENAQYPLSNLKDDRRTKTFRSTSNTTTIVFDLGTAQSVNIVALVPSTLSPFDISSATIEFNTTNIWTTPAFSQAITVDSTNNFAYTDFASKSYRYIRLSITSTAGYAELSKIFLGTYSTIGTLSFTYPINFSNTEFANISINRLGQRFIDEIATQREIVGSFQAMNESEFQDVLDMLNVCSKTSPVWLVFPEGFITEDNDQLNGYYYLKDDPAHTLSAGNFWSTSLSFVEGM